MRAPNLAGGGPEAESRGSRAAQEGWRHLWGWPVVSMINRRTVLTSIVLEQTRSACVGSRLASSLRSPTPSAPSPAAPLSDEHVLLGMLRAPEPRRPLFSRARERNFWLVHPFSINGATDGPGADDSGGAGHKVWPPAAPSAGGPVRAAGASGARVVHDSDRLRRLEDAVARFAQGLVFMLAWSRCPASGSFLRRAEGRIGEAAASSANKGARLKVLLAAVLFLVGIGSRCAVLSARLLAVAGVLLVVSVVHLSACPGPPS